MIIVDKHGRKRSILSSHEMEGKAESIFESLTETELSLLYSLVDDNQEDQIKIHEEMLKHRYHTMPVTMKQFIEDPYYLGESCSTIYPELKKDLIELFDYPHRECIFTGAIGVGKTFSASIALCRVLYELSCLSMPQKTFGLSSGTEMVIPLISKNLILAREVMKTAVDDKIKESPYFMERFAPKFSKDNTIFPNNIRVVIGSYGSERILGANVFSAFMDETNFPPKRKDQQITTAIGQRKTAAHFDPVEKVYRNLIRRIKSRFQKAGGDFPGMVILASSAATLESFTERKVRESENDPDVFVRDHAPWTAKPEDDFCGEKFWVVCSTSSIRARILEEDEYDEITDEYLEENDAWLLDIPIEYINDFETDIENALRDIAGISTQAISAFIQRVDAVDECATEEIPHNFTMGEWTAGGPGSFKWGDMCKRFERRLPGGYVEDGYIPIVNPKAMRWIHVDTSVSGDATGFAMGHIDRWVEVVRRGEDGERYTDYAPFYYMDIILRINPPRGEQIYMPDIRRLVYEIQAHGYSILGFSTDKYQYVEMHQQIKRRGIHTELISMDEKTDPYDEVKRSMYENRIRYHRYEPFIEELKALEYDRVKGKIDHPQAGSKDCLSGDTKVSLLSGGEVPIRDLVGREFWVYSCKEDGEVVPGRARNVHFVGERGVIRVWLDNGEYFDCTGDHEVMMRDGSFVEAKRLSCGDSLMPLYRKLSSRNPKCGLNGYEQYYDNRECKYLFTHQSVAKAVNGFSYTGCADCRMVIHHSDFNKRNNDPENLVSMEWGEHLELHCGVASENMKRMWADPGFREGRRLAASELGKRTGSVNITRYNKSDDRIEKLREDGLFRRNGHYVMVSNWKDSGFRRRHHDRVSGNSNPFARKDITLDGILDASAQVGNQRQLLESLGCTQKVVYRILRENGLTYKDIADRFGHVRSRRGADSCHARSDITFQRVVDVAKTVGTVKELCRELGCTPKVYHRVLRENDREPGEFGKEHFPGYKKNHCVDRVESIGKSDVYDMTVDEHHNFAISSGVFVHNCSDAVAGVIYGLLQSSSRLPIGLGAGTTNRSGHEHAWVSPMIPASGVDIERAKELIDESTDESVYLPIIFGD